LTAVVEKKENKLEISIEISASIWPKLWQNLRASRETELLCRFCIKDVCNWLGNTPAVELKHYLRADNDALRKATQAMSPPVAGDLSGDLNTPELAGLAGTDRKSIKRKDQQKTPFSRCKPQERRQGVRSGNTTTRKKRREYGVASAWCGGWCNVV
jgi:hypothetical protein